MYGVKRSIGFLNVFGLMILFHHHTLFTKFYTVICKRTFVSYYIMSKQQSKISTFFQRNLTGSADSCSRSGTGESGQCKDPLKQNANNKNSEEDCKKEPVKRQRDENDNATDTDSEVLSLCKRPHVTDENATAINGQQKEKAEENRQKAKMLLVKKQTSELVADIGPSWFNALETEFSKPYFLKLAKFVNDERKKHTVYPPPEQVFAWTQMTPIKDIKVVILGQDPYHGPNQAHGLCFSVQKGVALPPSLENMYQELSKDIDGFIRPSHGCLVGWAQQGVLLLNAVLTVRAHSANSHKDQGWELFTDAVVAWLNTNTKGTVFILWGSYAQKKGAHINRTRHHVLQGVHPSPLSAYRGFFGCHHFSRCNEFLVAQGKTPIDWSLFV